MSTSIRRSILGHSFRLQDSYSKSLGSRRSMASMVTAGTRPHVLIVGGAYGGLSTIVNLINLGRGNPQLPSPIPLPEVSLTRKIEPRITLLDERDGFFHTMGAPLAHTANSFVSEAWRPYNAIKWLETEQVSVLQGTVRDVDVANKVAKYTSGNNKNDEEIQYDYLVLATGMRRHFPVVPSKLQKADYFEDARTIISELEGTEKIAVIGGGAVGVEFAGEVKLQFPEKEVLLVHSREQLLSHEPLPDEFKTKSLELLLSNGVQVVLNNRVMTNDSSDSEDGRGRIEVLTLSDGTKLNCGKVLNTASSHSPATQFLPPCAVDEKGYVKVLPTMQMTCHLNNDSSHFAVGDIVAWPGIKRVGGALIMGQHAATNIIRLIAASSEPDVTNVTPNLVDLPPFPSMMTLAIGKTAVSYREGMGMNWGEEIFQRIMGRGLGIEDCKKALQLDSDSLAEIRVEDLTRRRAGNGKM